MAKRRKRSKARRRRNSGLGSFAYLVNPGKKRRRRKKARRAPKMARRKKSRRRKHNPFSFGAGFGNPGKKRRRRKSRRHNPRRRHSHRRRNPGGGGGLVKGFISQFKSPEAIGGAIAGAIDTFAVDPLIASDGLIGRYIPIPVQAKGAARIALHGVFATLAPKAKLGKYARGMLAGGVAIGTKQLINRALGRPAAVLEDMAESYGTLLEQQGVGALLEQGDTGDIGLASREAELDNVRDGM